jgi:hypothetical protein
MHKTPHSGLIGNLVQNESGAAAVYQQELLFPARHWDCPHRELPGKAEKKPEDLFCEFA